ncbi:MAG: helix-turn-helix domain-containing protein [Oscillospiraceae bacterium]|nr:helix-turn-helix domain-containing protein [Oscillospiraceae bacterium]
MNVKIGEKIKHLRRRQDVTQEKLAEYLGVTPQAISRWESETGYPDIETLPALADFFGVTTDELLGVDAEKRFERVVAYLHEGETMHEQRRFGNMVVLFRQAVAEFPSVHTLHKALADALVCKNQLAAQPNMDEIREAAAIYKRVAEDCDDDEETRSGAESSLCQIYVEFLNDVPSATAIADARVKVDDSREVMKARYIGGETNVLDCVESLASTLFVTMRDAVYVGDWYTVDEKLTVMQKAVALITLIFGEDCLFHHTWLSDAYQCICKLHIKIGDNAAALDALDALERAADHAARYDARAESDRYTTTALLRRQTYDPERFDDNGAASETLLQHLAHGTYDPIRADPRFAAVITRLNI